MAVSMDWLELEMLLAINSMRYEMENPGKQGDIVNPQIDKQPEDLIVSMLAYLKGLFVRTPNLKKHCKKFPGTKSNEKSTELREEGDNILNSSEDPLDIVEVLQYYARSIAFAAPNSEQLALAYFNRSALLLKLQKYEECLIDVERVSKMNCSEMMKAKLHVRRGDCLAKMAEENFVKSKTLLQQLLLDDCRKVLEAKLQKYPVKSEDNDYHWETPKVKAPHTKFPCASDAIDVNYSEKFGRHVVATRDIEVGEVLVVERPYLKLIDTDNAHSFCCHCLKFMWNSIACDCCANILYCSEDCKKISWNQYHRYECLVLDMELKYSIKQISAVQLSTRFLLKATNEAGGLHKLRERINTLRDLPRKFTWPLKDEWYQIGSCESILTLMTRDFTDVPNLDLMTMIMTALRSVFFLGTSSTFFGKQFNRKDMSDGDIAAELSKNPDVKLVAGILFKLLLTRLYNQFRVDNVVIGPAEDRGRLLLPFTSLINHSCNPNLQVEIGINEAFVYASLPIKKGDQMCYCYEEPYTTQSLSERRENLEKDFGFACDCIACKENWPTMQNLLSYQMKAKSDESEKKIKEALAKLSFLKAQVLADKASLQEQNEALPELYIMLKTVYEGVHLPCRTVEDIALLIRSVYFDTINKTQKS